MPGDFQVDPTALRTASTEIIDSVKPAEGMDLESISASSEWYGHEGVYGELARFCPTWQIAVALLTQRSATAGQALLGMAQRYVEADDSGGQLMKQVESNLSPS